MIQYQDAARAHELQRPHPPAALLSAVKVMYIGALVSRARYWLAGGWPARIVLAAAHPGYARLERRRSAPPAPMTTPRRRGQTMQSYPKTEQMPWIERPAPPAPVLNAIKVMYAGAVASVIGGIIFFVTKSATKTAIEKRYPHYSAHAVSTLTNAGVIIGLVIGLIGAALFIWIARLCKGGKNWARITGTWLFVLSVLIMVHNFLTAETAVTGVFHLLISLIGLTAVTLLWLGNSNAYFNYFKRAQF